MICVCCCFGSTVNIASCLLGSAQSNMANVKSKLLQLVAWFGLILLCLFDDLLFAEMTSTVVNYTLSFSHFWPPTRVDFSRVWYNVSLV